MAGIGGDRDVGDGSVFRLAGPMADHRGVGVFFGEFDRIEGLGERADLVDFDQDRIGDALFKSLSEKLHIGDEQVVTDELDLRAERIC